MREGERERDVLHDAQLSDVWQLQAAADEERGTNFFD